MGVYVKIRKPKEDVRYHVRIVLDGKQAAMLRECCKVFNLDPNETMVAALNILHVSMNNGIGKRTIKVKNERQVEGIGRLVGHVRRKLEESVK